MQMARREFLLATSAALAAGALADSPTQPLRFATNDDGKRLMLMEDAKPVFTYNYAPVDPPAGVDAKFRRANYLHPLYSPGGAIITEDFPKDHFHHRGVFWAWPNCHVGERKLNIWELDGARTVFKEFSALESSPERFHLQERSVWQFDADQLAPVEERVGITVSPSAHGQRTIDFELSFANTTQGEVSFQGSAAAAGTAGPGPKGYGGFSFRPDATNKPFSFTAASGVVAEDKMSFDTPWADISWGDGDKRGVMIIQHPKNPGFPHPGWIFRHYGFLGASWPHNDTYTLKAGESFTLRYRLLVHEGDATAANVADAAAAYIHV